MGTKPTDAASNDDGFVIELGKRHGRQEFASRPNLTPHALSELAYEAWWNLGMVECEDRGLETDDERISDLYSAQFEAEYQALAQAAGPLPVWQTPRLNQLRADLGAAGVSEERLVLVDAFIADAGLDEGFVEGVKQFCELFEYIFGQRDTFPNRWPGKKPYLEIDAKTWGALFFEVPRWDDVELRLCTWIWQLRVEKKHALGKEFVYRLVPDQICAYPGEDVFEIVKALLLRLGEPESEIANHSIEYFTYAALSEDDELTSFGRYLLASGFDRVFPQVLKHRRVSYYVALLLHHAPEVFDQHRARFDEAIADSEGWKRVLAEVMLRRDKARYTDTVLAWVPSLTSPSSRSHLAIYLCRADANEHETLVLELTRQAIADFGDSDSSADTPLHRDPLLAAYAEYPNSSVKLCLVATVLRAYGEEAFAAVKDFRDRHEGTTIRFYELLGKFLRGHPGALEILVGGLMKRLPDELGGLLTYKKYLKRLVAALRPFDLTPYRKPIKARFAGKRDRAAAAIVAALLR